jgi:hypothetical protein
MHNLAWVIPWPLAERPASWAGLHKVFELVEQTSGGPRRIEEMGWATRKEMRSFTGTANHPDASGDAARHSVQKGKYNGPPMDIRTAVALIRRLASRWLDSRVSAADP